MGIKTIVLITTGQPSVNPRIVKEADALQAAGFKVVMLYCFWIEWAIIGDIKLLKRVKWNYRLVGGTPTFQPLSFLFTKLRLKANRWLSKLLGDKWLFAERSQARCYDELLKVARSIKADWYIGHNLGALPVVVKAAQHNNAKCGFDFEDYHREEVEGQSLRDLERIIFIEEKYVPQLTYISTASALITEKVNFNFASNSKIITIFNCFPLTQQPVFRVKSPADNSLRLFWFSQTIGLGRGLEVLFKVLEKLNDHSIHVTLAGRCNKDLELFINESAYSIKSNIHFLGIIQPDDLPTVAAGFDVGLALELLIPNNRNICLTNKIFTYLLSGNAVLLSQTAAQENFNKQYNIGESFNLNNACDLEAKIRFYKDNYKLELQRKHNYELASKVFNWENESKKLLAVIN